MVRRVVIFLSGCALIAFLPAVAHGQNCPDPTPIACGETIQGNNCSGPDNHEVYPCLEYTEIGPESYFLLTLEHGAELEITLQPDDGWFTSWDAALIMLPDLGGDCYPSVYNGCSDGAGAGGQEGLVGTLSAGSYHLIVDGYNYGSCGDFQLTVDCLTECTDCTDADGDGYDAHDAGVCPCGTDCNDSDPARNPGADEICGDGIDQDCDGADAACPTCAGDLSIFCDDANTASTSSGASNLNNYCGTDYDQWGGAEYVLSYTAQDEGTVVVTVGDMAGQQLDAFAFTDFGVAGVCNKDACVDASTSTTGTQQLAFYTGQDETTYIAVDGRSGDGGSFSYDVDCRQESCTASGDLACGSVVTGDTAGASNTVSAYRDVHYHMLGAEEIHTFSAGYDAAVTLVLSIDDAGGVAPDLALVVLQDDGNGSCLPGATVAASDFIQGEDGNPPELLTFSALADTTYYVVVDAMEAGVTGAYTLSADCVVDCPAGQTDCGGTCVDLQTDPAHCGSCDNACAYDHAAATCVDGTCQMGACDAGFGDCNTDPADGCEADLTSTGHCGACGNACAYDHAAAVCDAGTCRMGACEEGFGDCDTNDANGCETPLDTNENCGACGATCTSPEFCHEGQCISDCPGGLENCDGVCIDTSSDVNNCGGCGNVCTAAHGTPGCSGGACTVSGCDDGWANCNVDASDGCETGLGTAENCADCGDACDFAHGTGRCEDGQCTLGPCETGWANCNGDPSDGCEADLSTPATCGSCSNTCEAGERCVGGACTAHCDDLDEDGHEDEACGGDDCDDSDASIHPGAEEICEDGIDQDCDGEDEECDCPDRDGDGHRDAACGGDDCNDLDGYIQPDVNEDCTDGVDNNCDGLTDCDDPGCASHTSCTCVDNDGDGYGEGPGCLGPDCDDNSPSVHPGAVDDCGDGWDQDCDGEDRPCPGSGGGCGCGPGPARGRQVPIPWPALALVALLAAARRRLG